MKKIYCQHYLQRAQSRMPINMSILLFFVCIFSLQANPTFSQSEKVDVKVEKGPLKEVFDQIEEQTPFHFFYNPKEVDESALVNIDFDDQRLTNVLHAVLQKANLSYSFLNNQIVIKTNNARITNSANAPIQTDSIKGKVTSKKGAPLPGVNVTIEGRQVGTATDFNGNYKIATEDADETLVFSFMGFKEKRIAIDGQAVIDVELKEELSELEQVVLIGYGEQKREDVSGAVSSVDTDELVQGSTGNVSFERGLGGLVKGVQVSQNSGRPGSSIRLNIRGVTSPLSSLAGNGGGLNQPLYVIDGVPFNTENVDGNPLNSIDASNIKRFDILKDAAATSIYGSRGANGVIIIETKQGKRNQKPTATMSYTTTFSEPVNTVDVLNTQQYRDYNELMVQNSVEAINQGKLSPFQAFDLQNIADVPLDGSNNATYNGLNEDYFGDKDTNWNDEIFRNVAITKKANFHLRGGTENTNYSLNLSYTNQEGVVVHDKYDKYNIGANLKTDITDEITVGSTMNLSHTKSQSGEQDVLSQYNVNTSVVRARPDLGVRDDNGDLLPQEDFSQGFRTLEPNPLMRLENDTEDKNYNFVGNAFVEIEPVENLKLKADVNAAVFHSDHSSFVPKVSQTDNIVFPTNSLLDESSSLKSNVVTNLTANYNFRFNNHNFNALAGFAWDRTKTENKSQFYSGFPDDDILTNPSSAEDILGYTGTTFENQLNSFFARLTYNYEGKYNATVNFRTDKSSKFGPSNKRAYFPSISASWNLAREDFLSDNESVDDLKFRASLGKVGSTNVANFAYLQFFNTSASDIYNGESAVLPNDIFPNEDIGWETTKELNVGLDFAFFKSRLRGSFDVYNRKTEGALVNTPIPRELGPSTYYANYIDVTNKGVEISLGGDIIRTEDFTWSAQANWSLNRNELDNLNGANIGQFQQDYFVEGEPVGTIKGYEVEKIIQSQDEIDQLNAQAPNGVYDRDATGVGDYQFKDQNGDGEITTDDRKVIGDIQPDFFGGFNMGFQYKNFGLQAMFQYSVGAETVWQGVSDGVSNTLGTNKYQEYALNTWTPQNRNARYAKAVYFDPSGNQRTSDRYLFDSSYLRFKSLQISYRLDKKVAKQFGLDRANFTVTGNNLATWTSWPGLDPETFSERNSITSQTSNEDPYPLSSSISVGIEVQF